MLMPSSQPASAVLCRILLEHLHPGVHLVPHQSGGGAVGPDRGRDSLLWPLPHDELQEAAL